MAGDNPRRVRATQRGYYLDLIRRPGDVFDLALPSDFSSRWMVDVDRTTPLQSSSAQSAIDAEVGQANLRNRGRVRSRTPDDDCSQALIHYDPFE